MDAEIIKQQNRVMDADPNLDTLRRMIQSAKKDVADNFGDIGHAAALRRLSALRIAYDALAERILRRAGLLDG